jgi:hypothetical protein
LKKVPRNRKPLFGLPAIARHIEQGLKIILTAEAVRNYIFFFFFAVVFFLTAVFFLAAIGDLLVELE